MRITNMRDKDLHKENTGTEQKQDQDQYQDITFDENNNDSDDEKNNDSDDEDKNDSKIVISFWPK